MILTKEQVEAIAARAEKATTLPWFAAPAATVQLAGDVPALIATVRELSDLLFQTQQQCRGCALPCTVDGSNYHLPQCVLRDSIREAQK